MWKFHLNHQLAMPISTINWFRWFYFALVDPIFHYLFGPCSFYRKRMMYSVDVRVNLIFHWDVWRKSQPLHFRNRGEYNELWILCEVKISFNLLVLLLLTLTLTVVGFAIGTGGSKRVNSKKCQLSYFTQQHWSVQLQ